MRKFWSRGGHFQVSACSHPNGVEVFYGNESEGERGVVMSHEKFAAAYKVG